MKIPFNILDFDGTIQEKGEQYFSEVANYFLENKQKLGAMLDDETMSLKVSFEINHHEVAMIKFEKENFIRKEEN